MVLLYDDVPRDTRRKTIHRKMPSVVWWWGCGGREKANDLTRVVSLVLARDGGGGACASELCLQSSIT